MDSPNTTPFISMEDGSSARTSSAPKKPRRCLFFSLGNLFVIALLGLGFLGMKLKMDKEGVEWRIVDKNEGKPVAIDEADLVVPDDVDADSDYNMPREPITDSDTGISFPAVVLSPDTDAKHLMGLGAGVRVKSAGPIKIKVYSACMYVEPEGAREQMSSFQGQTASQLRSSTGFYDALRDSTFDRAIRFVIKYKVTGGQMVEGLVNGISPRLRHYAPEHAADLTSRFRNLFTEKEFKVGDTILIASTGDRLSLTVNDDTMGRGVDGEPELIRSFFAIFTDADTPAAAARDRFGDRFPLLWDKKEDAAPAELSIVSTSDTVRHESITGLDFPETLVVEEKPAGVTREMTITGVSGRSKSMFLVFSKAVYGVSMYVEMDGWRNATAAAPVNNIYSYVRDADSVARAFRMQMAMGIQSGEVIKAFAEKLKPVLETKLDSADDLDRALCAFRNLFTFDMHENEAVMLHCSPDGRLYSVVNEVPRTAVAPKLGSPLCHALFEVYLGSDSVLGTHRSDLVAGLR